MSSLGDGERVPCPECSGIFSKRGIAGHRRFKHGVVPGEVADGPAQQPLPALPGIETLRAQAHMLARLGDLVERIDGRLERIEGQLASRRSGQGPGAETRALLGELQQVLGEIAALRSERERQRGAQVGPGVDGKELAPGDDALRELDAELGRLRMRQAGILMRLGKDAPGAPPPSSGPARPWF